MVKKNISDLLSYCKSVSKFYIEVKKILDHLSYKLVFKLHV